MAKAPAHLWIVGVLALLWNAFGALNYAMTQTRNEAWLAGLTPAQRAYVEGFPAWSEAAWALGVWGGVAGALLLLVRSRYAVAAFAVSLAGVAGTAVYQFLLSSPPDEMTGGASLVLHLFIWAIAVGLLIYAATLAPRSNSALRIAPTAAVAEPLPPVPEPPSVVIRTAAAEAEAAIQTLRRVAQLSGDEAAIAKDYLGEIAREASQQIPPPPPPPGDA